MRIRGFAETDQAAVDALLPVDASSVTRQLHRAHGSNREAPKRRRTLVAEVDGTIVGAATLSFNRIHPTRLTGIVEVAHTHRRRGIGTALFTAVRAAYGDARPAAGKVAESDAAAIGFVASLGGRTYQRCPGVRIDPRDPRLAAWTALPRDPIVAPLSSVNRSTAAELFTSLYLWLHADWSPVGSATDLAELSIATVEEADLDASSIALAPDAGRTTPGRSGSFGADEVRAVVLVFAEPNGSTDLVAETTHRDEAGGDAALTAAVARSLAALSARPGLVDFDGHDTDPHLPAVLAQLPWAATEPVLLVEVTSSG